MLKIANPKFDSKEKDAVLKVLESGNIAQGENVRQFEEDFANYIGTDYAIATSSGTTALHLSLLAAGIGPGDEVITTPFSFIATANSVLFVGAKPVFVDIENTTLNIDTAQIENKITDKTRAILPVHLYGHPCAMNKLKDLAEDKNLLIIEDACQAAGAEFKNKKVGSFGDFGCFSFYSTKNMTTGEGGMIVTDDKSAFEKICMLRNHGMSTKYHHGMLGFNFRMTDMAAAIGIEQLKKLDRFNNIRINNANYLNKKIKIKYIHTPVTQKNCKHVFHQYTIQVKNSKQKRDVIFTHLRKSQIECEIYYPVPIHKQRVYRDLGHTDSLKVAENASNEVLSLPVHQGINKSNLGYIVDKLGEAVE